MKLRLTCREATRLALQGEDRRLALAERLSLRLHLMVCRACPRFIAQLGLMRGAMGPWRTYRQHDEP